jgi:hypothetical protein
VRRVEKGKGEGVVESRWTWFVSLTRTTQYLWYRLRSDAPPPPPSPIPPPLAHSQLLCSPTRNPLVPIALYDCPMPTLTADMTLPEPEQATLTLCPGSAVLLSSIPTNTPWIGVGTNTVGNADGPWGTPILVGGHRSLTSVGLKPDPVRLLGTVNILVPGPLSGVEGLELHTHVALDDSVESVPEGAAFVFEVLQDLALVWRSGPVGVGVRESVCVPVPGVWRLTLRVVCVGMEVAQCRAVWLNPRLVSRGQRPLTGRFLVIPSVALDRVTPSVTLAAFTTRTPLLPIDPCEHPSPHDAALWQAPGLVSVERPMMCVAYLFSTWAASGALGSVEDVLASLASPAVSTLLDLAVGVRHHRGVVRELARAILPLLRTPGFLAALKLPSRRGGPGSSLARPATSSKTSRGSPNAPESAKSCAVGRHKGGGVRGGRRGRRG